MYKRVSVWLAGYRVCINKIKQDWQENNTHLFSFDSLLCLECFPMTKSENSLRSRLKSLRCTKMHELKMHQIYSPGQTCQCSAMFPKVDKHKQYFRIGKHEMFLNLIGNISASREANCVSATMFPRVGKHRNTWGNMANHNVSATMLPSLPKAYDADVT
jgi:hypothetical protein